MTPSGPCWSAGAHREGRVQLRRHGPLRSCASCSGVRSLDRPSGAARRRRGCSAASSPGSRDRGAPGRCAGPIRPRGGASRRCDAARAAPRPRRRRARRPVDDLARLALVQTTTAQAEEHAPRARSAARGQGDHGPARHPARRRRVGRTGRPAPCRPCRRPAACARARPRRPGRRRTPRRHEHPSRTAARGAPSRAARRRPRRQPAPGRGRAAASRGSTRSTEGSGEAVRAVARRCAGSTAMRRVRAAQAKNVRTAAPRRASVARLWRVAAIEASQPRSTPRSIESRVVRPCRAAYPRSRSTSPRYARFVCSDNPR